MLVRDRMSTPAYTVRPDTSFQQALAVMQEKGIRRLPVVDDSGHLVGIVAQRDLLIAALRFLQSRVDVSEVMAAPVITVTPDMPIARVATLMLNNKIGGIPVVEGDEVVGVITESDIFRCFVELNEALDAPIAQHGRSQNPARARNAGIVPQD
jgi:CBS domain-containing protein